MTNASANPPDTLELDGGLQDAAHVVKLESFAFSQEVISVNCHGEVPCRNMLGTNTAATKPNIQYVCSPSAMECTGRLPPLRPSVRFICCLEAVWTLPN